MICAGNPLFTSTIVNASRYMGGGHTIGTVNIGPDQHGSKG